MLVFAYPGYQPQETERVVLSLHPLPDSTSIKQMRLTGLYPVYSTNDVVTVIRYDINTADPKCGYTKHSDTGSSARIDKYKHHNKHEMTREH